MAVREKSQFIPNEIYFITITILGWKNIFIVDKYRSVVYKWLDCMKNKCNNKILGYVIMPNHLHAIIKISDKSSELPQLIQGAKRVMAFQIVKMLKEDGKKDLLNFFVSRADSKKGAKHKIFEDRYDSLMISSERFFLEKLNYVHKNPCQPKWRLAEAPENYKHSSASNYILGSGFYDVDVMEF